MQSEVMSAPVVASGDGAISGPISGFITDVRRWLVYRDTTDALSRLSRRELADIGVDTSVDDFAWRVADDASKRF